MYEVEKELLIRLCQKSNVARQEALCDELQSRGICYEKWGEMALVVPSATNNVVVLCAHYDVVPGSFGYNDNGMALVTALNLIHKLPYISPIAKNRADSAQNFICSTLKNRLSAV